MTAEQLNFDENAKPKVRKRLLLALLLPAIAALSSVMVYYFAAQKLELEWRQSIELDSEVCKERFDGSLDVLRMIARQLPTKVVARKYLDRFSLPTEVDDEEYINVARSLESSKKLHPKISATWLANRQADAVIYNTGLYSMPSGGLSSMPWYSDDMPDNEVYLAPVFFNPESGVGIITAAVKIVEDGRVIGFMGVDMDISFLEPVPRMRKAYSSLYTMLVDSSGIIVSHPDKRFLMRHLSEFKEYNTISKDIFGEHDSWGDYELESIHKFFLIENTSHNHWHLITIVDKSDVDWTGDILADGTIFNVFLNIISCVFLLYLFKLVDAEYRRTRGRERILFTILHNMPIALVIRNLRTRLAEYVNPVYAELFHSEPEKILNTPPPPEAVSAIESCVEDLYKDDVKYKSEERDFLINNQTVRLKYIFLLAKSEKANDDAKYVALIQDVSREKQAKDALVLAKDLAEAAKAGAEAATMAKSEFLARMSHELRTPMNAIIGLGHLMMRTSPSEAQISYLHKMNGAARRLLGIINDILDFSKIEAGKMDIEKTFFRLSELLDDLGNITSFAAEEKGLAFFINKAEDLPDYFIGDPLRISQVLLNLANNAIKFTDNGSITVSVSCVFEAKGLETDEAFLYFKVADTGIGIPDELRGRLFTPFSQVDGSTTRRFGGTGLGLAISRKLASLMGGTVLLEGNQGARGSVFSFRVKVGLCSDYVQQEATSESGLGSLAVSFRDSWSDDFASIISGDFSGICILLVEDNEVNQEIALEILTAAGFSVDVAKNGREAVDAALTGRYALVLMDIQMPVMDGFEATRLIRTSGIVGVENVPIIAMTANALSGDREKSLNCGMNDHLGKPFSPADLVRILAKWLRGC